MVWCVFTTRSQIWDKCGVASPYLEHKAEFFIFLYLKRLVSKLISFTIISHDDVSFFTYCQPPSLDLRYLSFKRYVSNELTRDFFCLILFKMWRKKAMRFFENARFALIAAIDHELIKFYAEKVFHFSSFVEKKEHSWHRLRFFRDRPNVTSWFHNSIVLITNFTNCQAIQRSHASSNTKLLYLNTQKGEKLLIR